MQPWFPGAIGAAVGVRQGSKSGLELDGRGSRAAGGRLTLLSHGQPGCYSRAVGGDTHRGGLRGLPVLLLGGLLSASVSTVAGRLLLGSLRPRRAFDWFLFFDDRPLFPSRGNSWEMFIWQKDVPWSSNC